MDNFAANLARLPPAKNLERLELLAADGSVVATIENKPGSQGSLRIYHYLARDQGIIDPTAAAEGLELYAEHTDDARLNPGKHPNIDRLLEIAAEGTVYAVRITSAQHQ